MAKVPFLIHKLPDRLTNLTAVGSVKDSEERGRKISASDAYFVEKNFRVFLESGRRLYM